MKKRRMNGKTLREGSQTSNEQKVIETGGGRELANKSEGSRYDRISELGEAGLQMSCMGMEGGRTDG